MIARRGSRNCDHRIYTIIRGFAVFAVLIPSTCFPSDIPFKHSDSAGAELSIAQIGAALLLLAMFAVYGYLLYRKKYMCQHNEQAQRLAVVSTLRIQPNHSIHIVRVDQHEMLVSCSNDGVHVMHHITKRDQDNPINA